jgi:two-component system, cell cycle sensor histidine kinase and response regulator CckA
VPYPGTGIRLAPRMDDLDYMTGLRHRFAAPGGVLLDGALAWCLAMVWLTGEYSLWLELAYVCVGLSALVRSRPSSTLWRLGLVSVVGVAEVLLVGADLSAHQARDLMVLALLGTCFAAFVEQRRRAERSVQEDHSSLLNLIDRLPLATIVFDEDANVLTWNRTAETLFGWRAEEVVGRQNPIVPADERASSDELLHRLRAGERLHGVEVERFARDGTALELAVFSAPLSSSSTVVLYADIRERRLAQAERDEALQSYQELVESLPLVTYVDEVDEHATNVYNSPQIEELLGWSLEEWAAHPQLFAELLHPDDHERVMAAVQHSNTSLEMFEHEYRLRHRDGHYVWVRDRSSIVASRVGRPFARGFLVDITEQKKLEGQLLQAQKMDALGQFAGGIAHDFNNLLTGIGGYADLATGQAAGNPMLTRCLDGIRTAAAEAASLTARLLTFSRRDVAERKLVDVNDLVVASAAFLERLLRANVHVDLVLAEDLAPVEADITQLKQVVLNLALNAQDAMREGGTLTLETEAGAGSVIIRVRDTGCGMDSTTHARAFEPFFTTKPEGEGTGLGLAVVYGVIDGLGGTLTLDSEPGAGTTVEIALPVAVGTVEPASPEPVAAAVGGSGARVLIVEDREIVRDLTREVLHEAGFEVEAAASGTDALELAAATGPFDLLLSDVVMPGMSGPELARRLRADSAGLPVLYMSGYTDDVLDPSELTNPATAFIRKPFGNAALVAAVVDALGYSCAPAALANASSRSEDGTG